MIRRPPRSTLFPTRRSSDLGTRQGPGIGVFFRLRGRFRRRPLDHRSGDGGSGAGGGAVFGVVYALRSEEHTSELQSHLNLVCRLLLEKKKESNRRQYTVRAV